MHCKSTFFQVRAIFQKWSDFYQIFSRQIKLFLRDPNEGSCTRISEKLPIGFSASCKDSGVRTREGSDGWRRKRKRGSRANRRDKKPMHVLLPAVRRLQSDDRFYGARLTDVNPGSSVGSSTRWLGSWRVIGAKKKKKERKRKKDSTVCSEILAR